MDAPTPWFLEIVFLISSSISIFSRALAAAPLLAFIYLLSLLAYALGCFKLRPSPDPIMFHSPLSLFNLFIFCTLQLSRLSNAQNATTTSLGAGTSTTYRPIFTVPSSADIGMYICAAISTLSRPLDRSRERSWGQTTFSPPLCCRSYLGIFLKEGILTPASR